MRATPLTAPSGPPHLLSWWVGSCRRSPLFLKPAASLSLFLLALMELYFRQRGKIFRLFLFLFQPLLLSSKSFFLLFPHNPSFFFHAFSYSPCLQSSTASGCVCVTVGGRSSGAGRQRSSCWKTARKEQPRKEKGQRGMLS